MKSKNKLIILKNKETLKFDDFYFKCCIGKGGTTFKKKEGDKKTPKGIYSLGNIFFRKDRVKKPKTDFKIKTVNSKIGWCNDSSNKKNYNKLIKLNKKIKHEKLFRDDYKYDYMIPILYNTKKTISGLGSAIFIHLTKNYNSTAGCIALKKKDFLILLKLINKNTKIKI